jgi:hypothetical protein
MAALFRANAGYFDLQGYLGGGMLSGFSVAVTIL